MNKILIFAFLLLGFIVQKSEADTWIEENVKQGAIIILFGGHMFEVYNLDRIDSALWLPLDTIVVSRNPDPPLFGYDWLLINTNERESVSAKYLGRHNSISRPIRNQQALPTQQSP